MFQLCIIIFLSMYVVSDMVRVCNRKIFFFISQPKHMLWVLKRTGSSRDGSFEYPTTQNKMLKIMG